MIKNGKPYSIENGYEDKELIKDLDKDKQSKVLNWIMNDFIPCDKPYRYSTSYGLKHIIQRSDGIYLTNNQFKDAMVICGFKEVDSSELNWNYYISWKSPAIVRERYRDRHIGTSENRNNRAIYEYAIKMNELREKYLKDYDEETINKVKEWIDYNFIKEYEYRVNSNTDIFLDFLYKDTGLKMTREAFNNIMFFKGFNPKDASNDNWMFTIYWHSPVFERRLKTYKLSDFNLDKKM